MNITEKTLLTTLTVAALSGGVISIDKLTSGDAEETGNSTGKTAETTEYVDNVKPIPVRVPKVRVFKVKPIPVRVPEIKKFEFVSPVTLEKLNIPEVENFSGLSESKILNVIKVDDFRTVRVSTVDLPDVLRAFVSVPEVEVKRAEGNAIYVNSPSGIAVVIPSAGGDVIAIPDAGGYKVVLPEVSNPAARMPQLIALQRLQQTLFRDQRNLSYDSSIGIDSTVWLKWIKIYKKDAAFLADYVPLKKGIRMIAEVTVPESNAEKKTLENNLRHYASSGYNAALLTFNTEELLEQCVDAAKLIRSNGLSVWIAYTGPEDLRHSVFVDPDRLTNFLETLAEYSEGFIVGWRRTALHQFLMDRQFYNVMLTAVRTGNPKIQILGESYLGETAETPEGTRISTFNNPANISGTVISGIGFYGVNVDGALAGVFAPVKTMNRVALIVGEKPYHMTLHDTKRSREKQEEIKTELENRFLRAGCSGTITLHGDGGTVIVGNKKKLTDSLCN